MLYRILNLALILQILMVVGFVSVGFFGGVNTVKAQGCGNNSVANVCAASGGVWNTATDTCDSYSPPPSGPHPTTPVPSGHTCSNNGNTVQLHWNPSGYAMLESDDFIKNLFARLFQSPSLIIPVAHAGGGEPAPPQGPINYRYEISGHSNVYTGSNTFSGQVAITPGTDYYFRVTAFTQFASNPSGWRHFRCNPPAPTVSLSAAPSTVTYNNASTLTWTSANATSCTASGGWSGAKALGGSQTTGALTASTGYNISCSGPGGTANASAQVTVNNPPPTVNLSANPAQVIYGNTSTLTWTSANATSCTAFDGWSGSKNISGSVSTGVLASSTQYRLACTGVGGTAQTTAGVTVQGGTGATITVDKPIPRQGETITFTYDVGTSIPNTCVLKKGSVSILNITEASGTYQTQAPAGETNYVLDCPSNPADVTVKTLPVLYET